MMNRARANPERASTSDTVDACNLQDSKLSERARSSAAARTPTAPNEVERSTCSGSTEDGSWLGEPRTRRIEWSSMTTKTEMMLQVQESANTNIEFTKRFEH